MDGPGLRTNPDALPDAPEPQTGRFAVAGTHLYAEVRGSGPAVLLIGAADEDAEIFRPVAERLTDFTVVTYDRRGTLRSGRERWPGSGADRHADDAAALLAVLGLDNALVFGASAGGIVALRLALRHPEVVRRALVFEPGCFTCVAEGRELLAQGMGAVERHLADHPGDWAGATTALGRIVVASTDPESRGLFIPPKGKEWYARRSDANAESLIRGDLSLTQEEVDEVQLASARVDLRFAYGTASLPIFEAITTKLAAIRGGTPDAIEGFGHGVYYHPDETAAYIRAHA